MNARTLLAVAVAALLPLASAEAQPRSKDTGKAKQPTAREERVDADDWWCPMGGPGPGACFGPGMGPGGGPGMGYGRGKGRGYGRGMGPGYGHFGGPGGRHEYGGMGLLRGDGRMADRLKLSTEQRRKLRALGDSWRREAVRMRADFETAHLDLHDLMRDDDADSRRVDQQIDALAALHAKHMKMMASHRSEVRTLLTPEQRSKLREMRPGGWGSPFGSDGEDEE